MRQLIVILTAAALTGCASTVLTEPIVHASPYLALYQLGGDTKLQSANTPTGTPPGAPSTSLETFGQGRSREDVGLRVDIGDGFGGFRADYYKLDMNTGASGELQSDWGALRAADLVSIYAEMDEVRLGYLEPLIDVSTKWRAQDLRVRAGAGGVFAVRDMKLRGRESTGARAQNVDFRGDVAYIALRARAAWRNLALDLDYAFAPEAFVVGGEVKGLSQDFEALLSYQLPQGDMRLFAGYRYSELAASGDVDGLSFENDLVIDGFQLGVVVTL